MVGRAIREGWDIDKQTVVAELMKIVGSGIPDLAIDAAALLVKCDAIDLKKEEVKAKIQLKEHEHRLRLLELARLVPVGELAAIASANGIGVKPNG